MKTQLVKQHQRSQKSAMINIFYQNDSLMHMNTEISSSVEADL